MGMRLMQGNFPSSENEITFKRRAQDTARPAPAPAPDRVERGPPAPDRGPPRPGVAAPGLSLLSLRAQGQAPAPAAVTGDYHPGLRNTVGWSRLKDLPDHQQSHLQRIEAGRALVDRLAPGLRGRLDQHLAVHEARREALRTVDARLVAEALRSAPTRRQADRKNVRLLELAAERHDLWLECEEQSIEARRGVQVPMGHLLYRLQTRHGHVAGRRADRIGVHPSLEGVVDEGRLRSWARAFYRLAGPNAPVPERLTFVRTESRPCFDAGLGEVNLGDRPDARVVFHELGHAMEVDVFDLMQDAEAWRQARSHNAHGVEDPVRLKELCPGASYGPQEVALRDHFISPYVGKVYEIFGSEVVSMGLEHFVSSAAMTQLYEQDPEHFLFAVGALVEVQP